MATEKTEKFPKALSDRMRSAYEAAKTEADRDAVVKKFDAETGYGLRSIRGKMSRDGYYIAKVRKNKAGGEAVRKETLVERIAAGMGVNTPKVASLENATKTALQAVLDFVETVTEEENAE